MAGTVAATRSSRGRAASAFSSFSAGCSERLVDIIETAAAGAPPCASADPICARQQRLAGLIRILIVHVGAAAGEQPSKHDVGSPGWPKWGCRTRWVARETCLLSHADAARAAR